MEWGSGCDRWRSSPSLRSRCCSLPALRAPLIRGTEEATSAISTSGLDSDGLSFSTAYRNLDSFFGKSFSLGFYTGSIDKPKPDYLFAKTQPLDAPRPDDVFTRDPSGSH
ncbi:hypothetical protein J2Y89_001000 [Curtobacterium herbarum]|uniref:hypothetical protein n=1 Tax=Curtobacterium herbarum TaxID=150122 RepID=UPI00209E1711|nr:hypothetical protein [Curtobacterium herbarum]MCP1502256.1 hypothetical protein [Curtobacterium herbarum]